MSPTPGTDPDALIHAEDITLSRAGQRILDGITLTITQNTRLLVRGTSGAGKTTLFDVLGLLTTPDTGSLYVSGTDMSTVSERHRARIRRTTIGLVFQEFHLIPDLTAMENAALPQTHAGDRDPAWVATLFDALDITGLEHRYPAALSGGEKQRVAIARALANHPAVVLADEPTGQLDPTTSDRVLDLLLDIQSETNVALVVISHDPIMTPAFDQAYELTGGTLTERPLPTEHS